MRNTEPEYLQYLFAKASKKGIPLSATFELTARCNFNCKMCYIHNCDNAELRQNELSTEQWKRIADEAQEAGVLMLLLTGGEPLLRDDFAEIYTYCKKKGFEINVKTNATLINEEIIELFKRYRPARVSISLYGSCDETYKNVTCRSGFYETVKGNILRLKSEGIQVTLSLTISDYNNSDIEELYKFAKEHQIPSESACYMFPSARLNSSTKRPSATDAAKNMVRCDKYCFGENFNNRKPLFDKISEYKPTGEAEGMPIKCRAGRAALWVTYDGTMLPCGMMVTPSVDVTELGISKAWEYIREECKKIRLPSKCSDCAYFEICDSCAASCYAETGKFDCVPEYLCQKSKEYVRLTQEEFSK